MLYGLGIALEPEKYQFAQGFTKFKEFLIQDGYVNAGTTANPNSCKQSA